MNRHQLKVEVHDLSNLLMLLSVYADRGEVKKVKTTTDVVLACFENIKHAVYSRSGENEMISMTMGERFDQLATRIPILEEVYNLKIDLNCTGCNREDKIFIPRGAPDAIYTNAIQNAVKAGATKMGITYKSTPYYVQLDLSDNGKGMTKTQIDDMPFVSCGQGVWLIMDAIHAGGGVCFWSSVPGEGTTLTIRLRKDLGSCVSISLDP